MKLLASLLCAFALISAPPAVSHAQYVGSGNDGNFFPFSKFNGSGDPATVYQQVYAASNFTGGQLQSVSFFASTGTQTMRNGTYALYVSTTTAAVNGLSTVDFDANRGADNVLFGTYVLGGTAPSILTFTGAPFLYDPTGGNLLLDFRITPTDAEVGRASFRANNGDAAGLFSRAQNFGSGSENYGLQTEFVFASVSTTVPEPATIVLMAGGLVVLGLVRRRTRRP